MIKRISMEAAADLIVKDLAAQGFDVISLFQHTSGFTIEVKEQQGESECKSQSSK